MAVCERPGHGLFRFQLFMIVVTQSKRQTPSGSVGGVLMSGEFSFYGDIYVLDDCI